MATLFTITKSLGYYGSGKNREELEVDETACLFGTDLWDIVKGYAGIRGVSKTAALVKQVLTPVKTVEDHRWEILPKRTHLSEVMGDWVYGKLVTNKKGKIIGRQFEEKKLTPSEGASRRLQMSKIQDILEDFAREERRQQGVERNIEYHLGYYSKKELLKRRLQLLGEDQDEYKLVRQNAFIQFP